MNDPFRALAYIGLGSNLDNPLEQIESALLELAGLPGVTCTKRSSLYETKPVGPQDQPDYINAVAELETELEPVQMLLELQNLEHQHQRVRHAEQWGPRTLDLDLLLYDQQRIVTSRLTLPHPRLAERAFVLVPLAEVAPLELHIPGAGTLGELLVKISRDGIRRLP